MKACRRSFATETARPAAVPVPVPAAVKPVPSPTRPEGRRRESSPATAWRQDQLPAGRRVKWGALAVSAAVALSAGEVAFGGQPTAAPYNTLDDAFTATVSQHFGFNPGYQVKDPATTHYRVAAPAGTNADDLAQSWYDVSNGSIIAAFDASGLCEYPSIAWKASASSLYTGSQWTFSISDGAQTATLNSLTTTTALDIVDNVFFKWRYAFNNLGIQMLVFAPEQSALALDPEPRALIYLVRIVNNGAATINGKLSVPSYMREANLVNSSLPLAPQYGPAVVQPGNHATPNNYLPRFAEVVYATAGYEAVMTLDATAWIAAFPDVSFSLAAGASQIMTFAFIVGANYQQVTATRDELRTKTALAWLNATATLHRERLGRLAVPAAPWVAELFERYFESCLTVHILENGTSIQSPKGGSWTIMSYLSPSYVSSRGFWDPGNPSNSLYAQTLSLLWCGDLYQRTGDVAYIQAQKNAYKTSLNSILATQYGETTLFPSTYIWDGPARGRYHTGSNLAVWRALAVGARLAGEVWNEAATATTWANKAAACKAAMLDKCKFAGPYGDQFAEGSWQDGHVDNVNRCHDAEEVYVALAAQMGFLEADDPLVVNHCKASWTTNNYLYNAGTQCMLWEAIGSACGQSSPCWSTLLAGATDNTALTAALDRWRLGTDVDGSVWWWPYNTNATAAADVGRRLCVIQGGYLIDTAKVDYGASAFLALLIHNVLGLDADVPRRTVSLRPFAPWDYSWTGGRIGNAFFDISYADNGTSLTASITNRNAATYAATLELTAPEGKTIVGATPTGTRYGRESLRLAAAVAANETVSLTLSYANAVPPSATLTAPATGAVFAPGADIQLAATASAPGSTVTKVEFYQGAVKLGEDTTSPYAYLWTGVPAGTYSLSAWAVNDRGAIGVSPTVNIEVRLPGDDGTGLTGEYCDNLDFTNPMVTRVDPTVDFDWGNGSPDPALGADTFSVRWTGQVRAQVSETYTFYTLTDDGVRLWVNGVPLVNQWINQYPTEYSGTVTLAAGVKYAIKMEYFENSGGAAARLSWSSPSTPKQVVPMSQLYPVGANQPPVIVSVAWADPNPVTLPADATVHVVASDPDGDPLGYAWSLVSGPASVNFSPNGTELSDSSAAAFSVAGTYDLRVTVADGQGGSVTSDVSVTVNPGAGVDPRADVNHDGVINALDLQIIIANFGKTVADPGCDARADANADGVVNALDLQLVIANFGNEVAALPTAASAGPVAYYDRDLGGGQNTTSHGDTFSTAWDRDGTLYLLADDTKGFDWELAAVAPGNQKPGRNLAVNRLLGTPGQADFRGHAIFGAHSALACFGGENEGDASLPRGGIWKATGLGSYDGILYLVVHDQTRNFPDQKCRATGAAVIKSVAGGSNWLTPQGGTNVKPASFIFPDPRFSRIAFVQYGADGRAPGDPHDSGVFVYASANDGDWDNGDHVYLGRVRRGDLPQLRAADWEFFTGLTDGQPQWGTLAEMQPVFTKPGRVSQTTLYYCPSRRCYLLPNWYYVRDPALVPADADYYGSASSGNTAWEFYAAPTPWGPWQPDQPFFTQEWHGEGYYNPVIVNKYSAGDVLSILCGANYWTPAYGLHYVELHLE